MNQAPFLVELLARVLAAAACIAILAWILVDELRRRRPRPPRRVCRLNKRPLPGQEHWCLPLSYALLSRLPARLRRLFAAESQPTVADPDPVEPETQCIAGSEPHPRCPCLACREARRLAVLADDDLPDWSKPWPTPSRMCNVCDDPIVEGDLCDECRQVIVDALRPRLPAVPF